MQVSWSPNHDDKFFTFGTDLCLYRVNDLRDENLLNPKEEGTADELSIISIIFLYLQCSFMLGSSYCINLVAAALF